MAVYYFSNSGSDQFGDGSQGNPFASVGKANSVGAPGDTLRFERGGTFGDATLILKEAQTVEAYGVGNRPTFNGNFGDGSACVTANAVSNWTLRSLRFGDTPNFLVRLFGVMPPILIDDCVFDNYGWNANAAGQGVRFDNNCGGTAEDTNKLEIANCTFSNCTGADHIWGYGRNVWVHHCDMADPGPSGGDNIHLNGGHWSLIEFNHLHSVHSGKGNIIFHPGPSPDSSIDWYPAISCTVRYNTIEDGGYGIAGSCTGFGMQVYYNTFINVGQGVGTDTWNGAHWIDIQDFETATVGNRDFYIYGNVYKGCRHVISEWSPAPQREITLNWTNNVICVGGSDAWASFSSNTIVHGQITNNIIKDSPQAVADCDPVFNTFTFAGNWFENTSTAINVCQGGNFITDTSAQTGSAGLDLNCCPTGAAVGFGPDTCSDTHSLTGSVSSDPATVAGTINVEGDAPVATNDSLISFKPQSYEPASSSAAFDMRNNHPILVFDGATDQEAQFTGIMPNHYDGGGLTVEVLVGFTSAISGTARFQLDFERIQGGTTDIDADSYTGTFKSNGLTAPATAGVFSWVGITFLNTEIDGIQAGDAFRLKLRRDADGTSGIDNITTTAEVRAIKIKET